MVAPVLSGGLHADGAIQPDGLAVEHRVLDDVGRERGVLDGRPRRAGKGPCLPSEMRAGSGRPASIGVSKRPGAMVMTRCPARPVAGDRSVMPTTPPLEAE